MTGPGSKAPLATTRRPGIKNRHRTWRDACVRGGLRALLALCDRLPERWLTAGFRGAALLGHWFLDKTRAEASWLAATIGVPADRFAKESFVAAGENVARCLLLRRSGFRVLDRLEVDAKDVAFLRRCQESGQGIVFASLHMGPFEWTAAAVAELGFPPVVVARESDDPELERHLFRHRRERGISVIHRGTASATKGIVRALRLGRPVGMMVDLARSVRRRPVRLGNDTLDLAVGPAILAARLECRLVLGVVVPIQAGQVAAHVLSLFVEPSVGDRQANEDFLARVTERLVRDYPNQWLVWGQPVRHTVATGGARALTRVLPHHTFS